MNVQNEDEFMIQKIFLKETEILSDLLQTGALFWSSSLETKGEITVK